MSLSFIGKLGRLPYKRDPRAFKLSKFKAVPDSYALPASFDWSPAVDIEYGAGSSWPMMGNDKIGDCVFAAMGHQIQAWTANAGKKITPPDDEIVEDYSTVTGYKPGDPSTDQGTTPTTALNWWRQNPISGVSLDAYAEVNYMNWRETQAGLIWFGGLLVALDLPVTAQSQPDVWDLVDTSSPDAQPGSWGGHEVYALGYDSQGRIKLITWGQEHYMTRRFYSSCAEVVQVGISRSWMQSNGLSPSGFNWDQLQQDLHTLND